MFYILSIRICLKSTSHDASFENMEDFIYPSLDSKSIYLTPKFLFYFQTEQKGTIPFATSFFCQDSITEVRLEYSYFFSKSVKIPKGQIE